MPLLNHDKKTKLLPAEPSADKTRGLLKRVFRTYKSKKKPFAGSLGVAISATRKRKKRMKEMEKAMGM